MTHTEADSHTEGAIITYSVISVVLVLCAGVFSGLTLSVFSIDVMQLMVAQRTGQGNEAKRARRLLALIERHHLVLVSLLISNAACMTALPIFLEQLLHPAAALIVSVTAVLFFGEVLPQATFVKHAVPVSAFFVPVIWLTVIVTFVISYPFSKLLDCIVGHKSAVLEREELREFFRMHEDAAGGGAEAGEGGLTKVEVLVMQGALRLSTQTVDDMELVKLPDVFMLSSNAPLDKNTVELILEKGFSRIPIYKDEDRRHILGVLLAKSLIPLAYKSPNPPPLCGEYPLREVIRASSEWTVEDLYEAFQLAQTHIAVVYNNRGKMVGIATLEDVFELLHSVSINDEFDNARQQKLALMEMIGDARRMSKARHQRSKMSMRTVKSNASMTALNVGGSSGPRLSPTGSLSPTMTEATQSFGGGGESTPLLRK